MTELKYKRNFCITAHIDHGKSTLADRLIQKARIIEDRQMMNQILDNMDIERERGITIKSQAVTIPYHAKDGHDYELNFVDTPGHVDFSYEVSRAIASCEGALLLIDATQGVESQTVSNMYLALEQDLTIVPVINKIDLASADVESVKHQIDHDLGLDASDAQLVSAKTGQGIDDLMEAIVTKFPAPTGDVNAPLKALIFDCHYDEYRGVIVHIRIAEDEGCMDSVQHVIDNDQHIGDVHFPTAIGIAEHTQWLVAGSDGKRRVLCFDMLTTCSDEVNVTDSDLTGLESPVRCELQHEQVTLRTRDGSKIEVEATDIVCPCVGIADSDLSLKSVSGNCLQQLQTCRQLHGHAESREVGIRIGEPQSHLQGVATCYIEVIDSNILSL